MTPPSRILSFPNKTNLSKFLCKHLDSSVRNHQVSQPPSSHRPYVIGLSGGSLIQQLSSGLTELWSDKDPSTVETWHSKALFVFCDERIVPVDSDQSTEGEYNRALFHKFHQMKSRVIGIDTSLHDPNECASDYEKKLLQEIGDSGDQLNLACVLLGMGSDGHTASLFPEHPSLAVTDRLVLGVSDSPKPPPCRVTLTLKAINSARQVVVVATGKEKGQILRQVLSNEKQYPIGMVSGDDVCWMVDDECSAEFSDHVQVTASDPGHYSILKKK